MRVKTMLTLLLVCASAASCAEKKEEWEIHYEKAEEYAEQYACGLALPEYDRAIELNPEDPELYLRRGLCHIMNKGTDGKSVHINVVENHDKALADFAEAESLAQGDGEMLKKIEEARAALSQWTAVMNTVMQNPELQPDTAGQEKPSCTPLDPVTYSYAVESTFASTTCRAYNDQDVLIYQDFYNGGKDKAGDNICRTYFFYDENGRLIREEYKWDSNALWYELMGGMPNVKEYIYDSDGDLSVINFLTPPDGRIFQVDHYNKRGELIYTEETDSKGTVTVTESAGYIPREEMEDWEALYDDALTFCYKGDYAKAEELTDQAIALHPEDPDMYMTKFRCVLAQTWNEGEITVTDPEQQDAALAEMIEKAEKYGAEPADIESARNILEEFRRTVLDRRE